MKRLAFTIALLLPLIAGAQNHPGSLTPTRVSRPAYHNQGTGPTKIGPYQLYPMAGIDAYLLPYYGVEFTCGMSAVALRLGQPDPLREKMAFGFEASFIPTLEGDPTTIGNSLVLAAGYTSNAVHDEQEGWQDAIHLGLGYRVATERYFIRGTVGYREASNTSGYPLERNKVASGLYFGIRAGVALWKAGSHYAY
ncbi:hypothetical protein KY327_00320 [Candidatus Woesearchaeota archaeon]|nr:hypothetical protein [Candidatus Woesearchaeota archaeon]